MPAGAQAIGGQRLEEEMHSIGVIPLLSCEIGAITETVTSSIC